MSREMTKSCVPVWLGLVSSCQGEPQQLGEAGDERDGAVQKKNGEQTHKHGEERPPRNQNGSVHRAQERHFSEERVLGERRLQAREEIPRIERESDAARSDR